MSTTPAAGRAPSRQPSIAVWALRRALLGLVIMTTIVALSAWLLHASIDPVADAQAQQADAASVQR